MIMKNIIIALLLLVIIILSVLSETLYRKNQILNKIMVIDEEIIENYYQLDIYKTQLINDYEIIFEKYADSL